MNFEPEIALLQTSFYCLETGLQEHEEHNITEAEKTQWGRVNTNAVCHAVREIVRGLDGDRTEAERAHWNFKLNAILFCKLLERRKCEDEKAAEKTDYFSGVSMAIPDKVDLSLYIDVANTFKWGSLCAKVLCSLDYKTAAEVLDEIAAECIKTDSLSLLVSALVGLVTPSSHDCGHRAARKRPDARDRNNRILARIKSSDTSESPVAFHTHVELSCEQICKWKSSIENRNPRLVVVRALAVCLDSLISELQSGDRNNAAKCHSNNHGDESSTEQRSWADPGAIYKLHLLSSSGNCAGLLEQWKAVSQESPRICDEDDAPSLEKHEHLCVAVAKVVYTLHSLLIVDWTDLFVDQRKTSAADPEDVKFSRDVKEITTDALLAADVCSILNRVVRCFGQTLQSPVLDEAHFHLMKQQCSEIEAHLSRVLDGDVLLAEKLAAAMETDTMANEQREHMWLSEAIGRVDGTLEGYKDDLGRLLSASDQWEEDAWMECLERNITALAVPRFMEQLIGVAMAMDESQMGSDVTERVLKVLLASYSNLPFPLQNKFRDRLWSYPGGVSVFARHGAGDFERDATSAFNRLVSLAQGQENTEVLTAVSCLALQHPVRTLALAVSRAVSNAAMCQAVCQALHAMPSLATFRQPDDEYPLLCHLINVAMATPAAAASEDANLLQLVTVLLRPFKPSLGPVCPFWMPAVLPTEAFARTCVFPNLRAESTDNRSRLLTVLKFLRELVSLQETRSRNSDAFGIGKSVFFPIMLCLCQLLDTCRGLWGGVATATPRAEVKEAVRGLLGRMGTIAITMPDDDERERATSWLTDRARETLHWSTTLALQEVLLGCPQYQKRLAPANVIKFCRLPDSEWSAIPSNRNHRDMMSLCDKMVEILLCCSVSESLANILSKSILLPDGLSNDDFLEALTLALVQVLPQSIMGEWHCIMGALTQLLTCGTLWVPCSPRYVAELPMANITDFRVHLGQSQLLLSVMQLLMSPCCQDWATPPLLHHVTRCYVSTMQQLLSQIVTSDLSDQPGCLFVIGQFFCHACDVIGSLTMDELKEQVFVLTLEVCTQMEIAVSQFSKRELGFELTNQIEVLKLLANQKLDGDQRKTLLMKMNSLTEGR